MRNRTSLFPHMPRSSQLVDKEGEIVEHWHLSLMNVYQTLQRLFNVTGYIPAQMNTEDFSNFVSQYNSYIGKNLPSDLASNQGRFAFDITDKVPRWFVINYNSDNTLQSVAWMKATLSI